MSDPRTYPPPKLTRTAIVTGGSQGIGRSTAEALVFDGWNVLISGRRIESLQSVVKSISERAKTRVATAESTPVGPIGQIRMIVGDMGTEDAVENMFSRAFELFGQVDLIFINAGIGAPTVPIQQLGFDAWKSVVDINLNGSGCLSLDCGAATEGGGTGCS